MAESKYRTSAEQGELSQDDPFAELTRIMGHDPRSLSPTKPRPVEPEDDLAQELENELMSAPDAAREADDLALARERAAAEIIPWRRPMGPLAQEPENVSTTDHRDAPLDEGLLDAELDSAFMQVGEPGGHYEEVSLDQERVENIPHEFFDEELAENAAFAVNEEDFAALDADHMAAVPEQENVFHEESDDRAQAWEYHPDVSESSDNYEPAAAGHTYDAAEGEAGAPFDYLRAAADRSDVLTDDDDRHSAAFPHAASSSVQEPELTWESISAEESGEDVGHEPDAWLGQTAPATETSPEELHEASTHGEYPAAVQPRHSNAYPPEVETIEVAEQAVPMAGNLELPEVRYREDVKPAAEFDEIEEILAGAFGETADAPEPRRDAWVAASSYPSEREQPSTEEDDYFATGIAVAAGLEPSDFADEPAGDYSRYNDRWAPAEEPGSLKPVPGVAPPVESGGSRFASRTALAVSVLGGLVILGGVSVLALTYSGGDGAEPVLVSADDTPVKVRPENPGGIQIPNQENQVYKRVSGEQAADARPAQQELISTTEEPVELPTPAQESADLRPGLADRTERVSTGTTDAGEEAPKIEERLTGESGNAESGVIALTPRRVRSLVVRPDGTMVPREVPEPVETTAATDSSAVGDHAPAAEAAAVAPVGQEQEDVTAGTTDIAATASADSGTSTVIPRTGPIPPSRPTNVSAPVQQQNTTTTPRPVSPRETPQAPPSQQQVAAASGNPPSQATAAAASEWSVQIASQPSVEGAQQSYQQMAQRFGNMLQGRGVNIVKADIEGKGTFYRVRIPSSSKDEAIQLCAQLKSAGGSCFVSK